MQGDLGHLPQCLFVEKVPGSPTLWGPTEKESNLQHPLLPNKPVALVGVPCNWDLFQGLGRVNPGATSQWPQPSSSSFGRIEPPLGDKPSEHDTGFTKATTQTTSLAMSDAEPTGHVTPLERMEEENWYVLVVTALIRQLNLGSADNDLRESSAAPPGRDTFQNPHMVAVPPGSTRRAVSYQGATVKKLEE